LHPNRQPRGCLFGWRALSDFFSLAAQVTAESEDMMEIKHSKKALKLIEQIEEDPNSVYTMDAIYPAWRRYFDDALFAAVRESLGLGSNGKPLFQIVD
jgi:hypothetical protein